MSTAQSIRGELGTRSPGQNVSAGPSSFIPLSFPFRLNGFIPRRV